MAVPSLYLRPSKTGQLTRGYFYEFIFGQISLILPNSMLYSSFSLTTREVVPRLRCGIDALDFF